MSKFIEAAEDAGYTITERTFDTFEDASAYANSLTPAGAGVPDGQWGWDVSRETRVVYVVRHPSAPTPAPAPAPVFTSALPDPLHELFIELARDAENWGGTPLVDGNVDCPRDLLEELRDLEYIGIDPEGNRWEWVRFTAKGRRYAAELGIDLSIPDFANTKLA